MRGWIWVAALALWAGSAGCDNGGTPVQVIGGASGVRVDVSSGTTPTYSWMGGRARLLTVQASTGEVFWEVEAFDLQDGFPSPARHGVLPPGARTLVEARPLVPGEV